MFVSITDQKALATDILGMIFSRNQLYSKFYLIDLHNEINITYKSHNAELHYDYIRSYHNIDVIQTTTIESQKHTKLVIKVITNTVYEIQIITGIKICLIKYY